MADLDVSGFGPDDGFGVPAYGAATGVGRVMNMIGAALSVALVGGLGYWGYDLMVRDVAGIPVIQAMEGPMRVQPDNPGGERAAHQGLAVNRIAALGEAAPPPDEIVLAPRSADLEAEDLAQAALRATPAVARLPEGASVPRPQPAIGTPTDPVEAAILAAATGVMTAEAELSGDGLIEAIPASLPGPSRSLRPRLRPPGFAGGIAAAPPPAGTDAADAPAPETAQPAAVPADATPAAVPANPQPVAVAPGEVDPATLGPGTRLVQFGTYADPADARAAWAALGSRYGALMDGKGRVIEPAAALGRTFYRLRAAGFDDLADARRFCAPIIAEGGDCIPVLVR
jgi:hypothetical protein